MYNLEPRESELIKKIKDGSKCLEDYRLLGDIYYERGEYQKYLALCEKTLNLSITTGEKSIVIYEKGDALALIGKRIEAVSCFEQSLSLLTHEKETDDILCTKGMNHYNLVLYSNDKRRNEYVYYALKEFEELLKRYPEYKKKQLVNSYLAELYCRNNEYVKAIEAYKKAIEMSRNNDDKVWGLSGIASVYSEKGDFDKSEEAFKQALSLAENKKLYSKVYFYMGEMYFKSDHRQEAIDAFNIALNYKEYTPNLKDNIEYIVDIFWHLGTLAYENNDYDKGIEFLNKTLERIKENDVYFSNTHIALGHCYLAKEDYDMAKEHYNVALSSTITTEEEIKMANKSLKEIEKRRMGSGMHGIGYFFSKIIKKKK